MSINNAARKARHFTGPATLLSALFGGVVATPDVSAQDDVRNNSVTQRERPDYEPEGIASGPLSISPQISLGASADDNIFADDINPKSDYYLTIRPEIDIDYKLSNNALNFKAYFERDLHARFETEDTSSYGVQLDGKIEIDRLTRFGSSVRHGRRSEKRGSLGSSGSSAQPVEYDDTSVEGRLDKELGALRFMASGRARKVTYADTPGAGGV